MQSALEILLLIKNYEHRIENYEHRIASLEFTLCNCRSMYGKAEECLYDLEMNRCDKCGSWDYSYHFDNDSDEDAVCMACKEHSEEMSESD